MKSKIWFRIFCAMLLSAIFAGVLVLDAQEKKASDSFIWSTTGPQTTLTLSASYRTITFSIGSGLSIDCSNGNVTLPKDMKMDDAAIEFWKSVAKCFPEARRQIIEGEKKP